jgi:hypothetical protein
MKVANVMLTAVLILVLVYVLFSPKNHTTAIVHALGSSSSTGIRTLTGQYQGSAYS